MFCVRGVHQRGVACDLDLLADVAHGEAEIHGRILADHQRDPARTRSEKPSLARPHFVLANRKSGQLVAARGIGQRRARVSPVSWFFAVTVAPAIDGACLVGDPACKTGRNLGVEPAAAAGIRTERRR